MFDKVKKLPHNHDEKTAHLLMLKPTDEVFSQYSTVFSLLGDNTRLKILWFLCNCEECVVNIAAAVEMSSPAVSHHLRLLKQSGLIVSRRDGKEIYYKISTTEEAKTVKQLITIALKG